MNKGIQRGAAAKVFNEVGQAYRKQRLNFKMLGKRAVGVGHILKHRIVTFGISLIDNLIQTDETAKEMWGNMNETYRIRAEAWQPFMQLMFQPTIEATQEVGASFRAEFLDMQKSLLETRDRWFELDNAIP